MRLRGTRAYAAPDMTRIAAILPAAGMGTRMGAETPKQFLELNGTPIVILSLRRIASCTLVTDLIVATRADEIQRLEERIAKEKLKQPVRVVKGGDSRQDSVAAALREVPNEAEIVLVHDAVRPFVTVEQITRDRKSTRLNSSHGYISYAVFCLKKKNIRASHIFRNININATPHCINM